MDWMMRDKAGGAEVTGEGSWLRSLRTSGRQQLCVAILPHCPCMERQQALSPEVIVRPATHATAGAIMRHMSSIATALPNRRMLKV